MANGHVCELDPAVVHAALDQLADRVDQGVARGRGRVATNEADTNAVAVVAGSVGSDAIPTTTFVDVAVAADQEVVADVGPAVAVHVVVLEALHHRGARRLGGAGAGLGVVDHHVGNGVGQVGDAGGWTSTPARSANNVGACCN